MHKMTLLLLAGAFSLSGCVVVPMDQRSAEFCPPGQAKKGACQAPQGDGGFCPPGQAKKGNC